MGSLNHENSLKQDLDDSGYVQDASASENSCRGYAQLLDLSDDVLLYILQYLTPRDLKALGHTCPRLGTLICDRTLWTKVDARTSPVGQQRLRWLLTHCLSPATTELKIAGYANKFSRCLGIQDLHWPVEPDQDFIRGTCIGSQEGVDVEHFLLRMWYPHLPRFAVSPRWPDKAEADSKNAKAEADNKKTAEAATSKSGDASSSSGSSGPSSSSSGQNSSSSGYESGKSDKYPASLGQSSSKSDQNAGCSAQNSSKTDQNSSDSSQNPSSSGQNPDSSESKKENKCEYPFLFEDDVTEDCKGPQFTLTTTLMRDLRKTCSQLTSLALEYCNLDYKTTNLRHFPLHLKKLSLRGSRCYNLPLNTSYLGKVQERLPKLEYLDVSECDWFEPASLMPLSKLAALTELYMRDCKRLTECVAYASLATRYGFRKLRVFDVRGSPLADSEVSALGWLPRLEELYVAPPDDYNHVTEHTHPWADTNTVFTELDSWEIEEPDYYKIKSPESEQEEDEKEDEPENERQGDVLINNPWWSHERRIIVIQPNASRQELEQRYPPPGQRQPGNEEEENWPGQPRQAHRVPRPGDRQPGPVDPQPGPANPQPGPANPQPGPANPQPGPANPQPGPANPQPGPANPQPGPANPRPGPAYPRPLQLGSIDIVPINPPRPMQHQPVLLAPRPGPVNPRPVPSDPRQGPTDRPGNVNPQPGPANQQPGSANPGEGTSKRRLNVGDAIDLAKRRRIEDDEDEDMQVPLADYPINFPPYNPELCPRLRLEDIEAPANEPEQPRQPGCVRFRRHDLRPIMHIDVDIHRQSTIHIGSHVGYHLVSDSALLRFGRAENENVNYVHIGRNGIHHGSETGSRPDRSNLRILSVTGYRNITDRSLEHLVTAAPYLLHIDFTETNVTPRGVELFKAVRPDCDVIFSEFGRMT